MIKFYLPLVTCSVIVALTPNALSATVSATEDFSTHRVYQTSWIVGAFGGIADIIGAGDSLGTTNGNYELNWNGKPRFEMALYNNRSNNTTFINFRDDYEWTTFSGDFTAAWDDGHDAQVGFNFQNLDSGEHTEVVVDLTNNYNAVKRLQFSTTHSFNRIAVAGPFVVMDNLIVTILGPVIGDMNYDGVADNLDITPFLIALTVGGNEEAFLAEVPGGKFYHGDVDHDGFVSNTDITPFIGLLTAAGSNATAVPEPGSLACVVLALMMGRRRAAHLKSNR